MAEQKIPGFIQDYLNEIHDWSTVQKLHHLAREYNGAADDRRNAIGAKHYNAKMWEKQSGQKQEVNLQQELGDLEKDYKTKAGEIAKPHIEPEKFEEISKRHQGPPPKTLGEKSAETEKHLDKKQQGMAGAIEEQKTKHLTPEQKDKRQEFIAQMKAATERNKGKEKERD